jgi:phage-related protein
MLNSVGLLSIFVHSIGFPNIHTCTKEQIHQIHHVVKKLIQIHHVFKKLIQIIHHVLKKLIQIIHHVLKKLIQIIHHVFLKIIQIIHHVFKFIQIIHHVLFVAYFLLLGFGWLVLSFFLSFFFRARHK